MVVMGRWHIKGSSDNLWVSRIHPLDESKQHKIILESMAVRLGQKGSIYTRINLKTIHFPGLTANMDRNLVLAT